MYACLGKHSWVAGDLRSTHNWSGLMVINMWPSTYATATMSNHGTKWYAPRWLSPHVHQYWNLQGVQGCQRRCDNSPDCGWEAPLARRSASRSSVAPNRSPQKPTCRAGSPGARGAVPVVLPKQLAKVMRVNNQEFWLTMVSNGW